MSIQIGQLVIEMATNVARLQKDMDAARRTVDGTMQQIVRSAKTAAYALSAIGVGVSINGLMSSVNDMIKGMERLHDAAIQTGVSVAALGQFRSLGKLSDTGLDQIIGSFDKLAKGLSKVDADGAGAAAALRSLGVDFSKFKAMSPDQQLLELARAMDKFADGSGKSAAAQALLGKEGAKMLPFLKDLAQFADDVSASLTEQSIATKALAAAYADAFEDNLVRIRKQNEDWRKDIVSGMTPALYELSQAYLEVIGAAGGLKDAIKQLSADGSITEWTRQTITALTYVMDALQGTWRGFELLYEVIKTNVEQLIIVFGGFGQAAMQAFSGEFEQASQTMSAAMAASAAEAERAAKSIDEILNRKFTGNAIREAMEAIKGMGMAAQQAKPALDFQNKSLEEAINLYKRLSESINKRADAAKMELELGRSLTESEKFRLEMLREINTAAEKIGAARVAQLKKELDAAIALMQQWQIKKDDLDAYIKLLEFDKEKQKEINDLLAKRDVVAKAAQDQGEAALRAAKNHAEVVQKEGSLLLANGEMRVREIEQLKMIQALEEKRLELKKAGMNEDMQERILEDYKQALQIGVETAVQQFKIDEFRKVFDQVGQSLSDAIMRGGKDAGQLLKDYFKTLVLQPIIKAIVDPIAGSIVGTMSSGFSAAANGTSTASSLGISAGGSALGNMVGGSIGSSIFGSSAAYGAAIGTTSIGAGSQAAMLAAQTAEFGFAGTAATSSAAAGAGAGASSSLATAAAAAPYVAAALVVANALGLFRGTEQRNSGLVGTLGGGDIQDARVMRTDGTLFYGPDYNTQIVGVSKASALLQQAFDGLRTSAYEQARALGISNDAIRTFTTGIGTDVLNNDKGTVGLSLEKLTPQQAQQKIAEALAGANEKLAQFVLGANEFARQGETAVQTLGRLSSSIATVNQVLDTLGLQKFAQTLAGADLASKLSDVFGGLSNLTQATSSYYDTFYTEQQRTATTTRQLTAALGDLGLALPGTREQFKALVDAQDLTTEAGRKTFAALINLSGAFAQITPEVTAAAQAMRSAADILSERQRLETQLLQLQGNTAELRARERGALDASNQALYDQINALQDAQAASAAVASAQSALREAYNAEIASLDALVAKKAQAEDALRSAYQREISVLDEVIAKKAQAEDALRSAYQREASALEQTASKFRDLGKTLREFSATLFGTTRTASESLSVLRGRFTEVSTLARAGDEASMRLLPEVGKQLADAVAQGAATRDDLLVELARINDAATASADTADVQATIADKQLDALRTQVAKLIQIDTDVLTVQRAISQLESASAAAAAAEAQKAILTNQVSALIKINESTLSVKDAVAQLQSASAAAAAAEAQKAILTAQVSALITINQSVLTVAQAIASLQGALATQGIAKSTQTIAAAGTITTAGGALADAGSYKASDVVNAIRASLAQGYSAADVLQGAQNNFGANQSDIISIARTAGIPGFATGGNHLGGWRMVGEQGPELEYTGQSRIFSNTQSRSIMDTSRLEAQMDRLTAEVEMLRSETRATAIHTKKTSDILYRSTDGGNYINTVAVPA